MSHGKNCTKPNDPSCMTTLLRAHYATANGRVEISRSGLMDISIAGSAETGARTWRTQRNLGRHLARVNARLAGIAIPGNRSARRHRPRSGSSDTGSKAKERQTGSGAQSSPKNGTGHDCFPMKTVRDSAATETTDRDRSSIAPIKPILATCPDRDARTNSEIQTTPAAALPAATPLAQAH